MTGQMFSIYFFENLLSTMKIICAVFGVYLRNFFQSVDIRLIHSVGVAAAKGAGGTVFAPAAPAVKRPADYFSALLPCCVLISIFIVSSYISSSKKTIHFSILFISKHCVETDIAKAVENVLFNLRVAFL